MQCERQPIRKVGGGVMKTFKIGVFGSKRGRDIAKNFIKQNCEIVALCDSDIEMRDAAIRDLGDKVTVYDDFDKFIEHGMDAVIIANYFHEHAPYAIKCLEKGIHVFSECISNGTMAEGIELLRAAEKSDAIYMLAENYPQMLFNIEMQRVCKAGTLGKILYAEGEYNHPGNPYASNIVDVRRYLNPFVEHWRNTLPKSYYLTHSLGPLMRATGATPKRVTAYNVFAPIEGNDIPSASRAGDSVSIMITQNDDGSVFRFTANAAFGGEHNSYRICGKNGQIENVRGMGNKVMLRYNSWNTPEGAHQDTLYEPSWNDPQESLIKSSGLGGGDFVTARMFLNCIKEGKQPEMPFDVKSAVTMSSVAILAHRSVLEGNKPFDIPDFNKEEDCKKYENDRLTPFHGTGGSEPTIRCSSNPNHKPSEEQLKLFKKLVMKIDEEEI